MNFVENLEVCFNQESLLTTYHNFRHKSLVRPRRSKVQHNLPKYQREN